MKVLGFIFSGDQENTHGLSIIFEGKVTKPTFYCFLSMPSTLSFRFFVATNQHNLIFNIQKFDIQNIIEQREAIDIITRYEEIIKTKRY